MPWHIESDDLAIVSKRFELRPPLGQVQTDRMEQEQWRSIAFDCRSYVDSADGVDIDKNGESPILAEGGLPPQQRPSCSVSSQYNEACDLNPVSDA